MRLTRGPTFALVLALAAIALSVFTPTRGEASPVPVVSVLTPNAPEISERGSIGFEAVASTDLFVEHETSFEAAMIERTSALTLRERPRSDAGPSLVARVARDNVQSWSTAAIELHLRC